MPNYTDGKIYKLVNDITKEFYIGSTCDKLTKRMSGHKTDIHRTPNSKKIINFTVSGWDNVRIVLIKDGLGCENKEQLLRIENDELMIHKDNKLCLNMKRAIQTREERAESARNYMEEYNKRAEVLARNKVYKKNKYDREKGYLAQDVICPHCLAIICRSSFVRHLKHIDN
jgi:hypothetical protein